MNKTKIRIKKKKKIMKKTTIKMMVQILKVEDFLAEIEMTDLYYFYFICHISYLIADINVYNKIKLKLNVFYNSNIITIKNGGIIILYFAIINYKFYIVIKKFILNL
jgi:hypothetical protein